MQAGCETAREVTLTDVRNVLITLNEHASGIIRRCQELRAHVNGAEPDCKDPGEKGPQPSGIVSQMNEMAHRLAERLQAIESLIVLASARLGVDPPPASISAGPGPRLARG